MIAHRSDLLIIGGEDSITKRTVSTVWKLDVASPDPKWSKLPDMTSARSNHAAYSLKGLLVVAGGENEKAPSVPYSLESFDGDKWRETPDLPIHTPEAVAIQLPFDMTVQIADKFPAVAKEDKLMAENFSDTVTALVINREVKDGAYQCFLLEEDSSRWREILLPLPYEARFQGFAALNNEFYLFGGDAHSPNSRSLYRLDESLHWEKMAYMNEGRHFISNEFAVVDGSIWVVGTSGPTVQKYDPKEDKWGTVADVPGFIALTASGEGKIYAWNDEEALFYTFDVASCTWSELGGPPTEGLNNFAMIVHGSDLVIIGGSNKEMEAFATVWKLNVTSPTAEWTQLPPMKKARVFRYFHAVVFSLGNRIVVAGGFRDAMFDAHYKSVEIFDGIQWTYGPDQHPDISFPVAVVLTSKAARRFQLSNDAKTSKRGTKDTAIVFNSFLRNGGEQFCSMIDFNLNQWVTFELKMPYRALHKGVVYLDGQLFVCGGEIENKRTNCLYKLDENLQWKKLASMHMKRRFCRGSFVALNGCAWAVGGDEENTVEKYDPVKDEWQLVAKADLVIDIAVAMDGKIYACLGLSLQCYDPDSNLWNEICALPAILYNYTMAVKGQDLLIVGGHPEEDDVPLTTVWKCNVTSPTPKWTQLSPLNRPRLNPTVFNFGNVVFVAGGLDEENGGVAYRVELFDGDRWIDNAPSLSDPVVAATAVILPVEMAQKIAQLGASQTAETTVSELQESEEHVEEVHRD